MNTNSTVPCMTDTQLSNPSTFKDSSFKKNYFMKITNYNFKTPKTTTNNVVMNHFYANMIKMNSH